MLDQEGLRARARARTGLARRIVAPIAFSLVAAAGIGASPSQLAGELDAKSLEQVVQNLRGKVVLVNFWATWCEPCREEFPDLSRLQRALGPRGLQVVGVSTDFAKSIPAVERFLARMKPGFPNYRKKSGGDDQDFINAVETDWGGELPFTVLYDRAGKKRQTLSARHPYAEYERAALALLSP